MNPPAYKGDLNESAASFWNFWFKECWTKRPDPSHGGVQAIKKRMAKEKTGWGGDLMCCTR